MRAERRCLDRAIVGELDRAAQDIIRVLGALPQVEAVMRAQLPSANGHAYDSEHRPTVIWCEHHEREVTQCHRLNVACSGVPDIDRPDPTGSAAASIRIFEDTREARRRADRILADADWLVGMANRYQPTDATPQVEKDLQAANTPLCERHLRYGYERAARSKTGSRIKRPDGSFVFADAHRLCEWCSDFSVDFGRLPTQAEVEANVQGRRIRRPA